MARVLTDTTTGGFSAELQGGSFERGAVFAGVAASAWYPYNKVVNYDINVGSGRGAVGKEQVTLLRQFTNNVGTANRGINPSSLFGEGWPAVELAILEERRRRDAPSGEARPYQPASYTSELTLDRIR